MQKALRTIEVQPLTGFDRRLAYLPPPGDVEIKVGQLVRIPLGRRSCLGVVTGLESNEELLPEKLKHVYELVYEDPVIRPETFGISKWLHDYYGASYESIFETIIPAPIRKGMKPKTRRMIALSKKLSDNEYAALKKRAKRQADVYDYLSKQKGVCDAAVMIKELGLASGTIRSLVERGVVCESSESQNREAYADTIADAEQVDEKPFELNEEQGRAVASICESTKTGKFQVHLLHGVTGSGKTEVYLKAMEAVLKEGGGVVFLVPEVALTPQTVGRIRSRLRKMNTPVVVWHSHLSDGERFDGWMRLARGEARVVVGARSAIFAPVENLKLVIVDEEHEPAYKQAESPRYHGRDVAVYRSMIEGAVCVLGSATPALESLYNVSVGKYKVDRLTKRIDDRELPAIRLVDLKKEMLSSKGPVVVSRRLCDALVDRFEKREQSILFLNRRGFSSSMLCPDCGYVAMSPDSSVTMTYHKTDDSLRCHLTGYSEPAPKSCPSCGSVKIRWRGFGTQKIEEVLHKILPRARIVRMDADTMSKKNRFREILSEFRQGKIDILLGTQMIAKGLDFPNVTLVGLIDADLSLHMPDFRAAERTFQLLVQVAGRAGRGDRAGEVIVQSFLPSSAPIQFAKRGDFDGFLEAELEQRREFNYPPFRHVVRHVFRGRNEQKVGFFCDQWVKRVEDANIEGLEIRGPAPAPLEKLRGEYRFHLWYFTKRVRGLLTQLHELRENFPKDKEVVDVIDVDPYDLA